MSRARVVVDDQVLMDDEIGNWIVRTPQFVADAIRPDAQPEPHMQAILIAFTGAIASKRDVIIEAQTHTDGGWTVSVKKP